MKAIIILIMGILISMNALGSQLPYNGPLMSKVKTPGFPLPLNWSYSECQIFGNKVRIQERIYLVTTVREIKLEISGPIYKLIQKVYLAPKERGIGQTDIHSETYRVFVTKGAANGRPIIFYQTGTRPILTKTSEAKLLKEFIDKVCKY